MSNAEQHTSIEDMALREVRYDLSDNELTDITAQLLAERPPTTSEPIVCYRIEQDSAYSDICRTIECQVFEKYFGNDAEEMTSEYGPYESQSVFFLSVDQDTCKPAGVLRAIKNGPAGLKTLNDLQELTGSEAAGSNLPEISPNTVQLHHNIESLDDCWDVGTVAVQKPYRSDTLTSVQLYRALYVSALADGIEHFVSVIDKKPYEKMTEFLGIPFVPLVGSEQFSYLGSESSQAVYGDVLEFYQKMNRKRFTLKGVLARKALSPLVKGTRDTALYL